MINCNQLSLKGIFIIIIFAFTCTSFSSALAQTSSYRISDKIHVEGDGGWDYLTADVLTGRLFVSHGTIVQVIDTKTKKVIGTISDTKGVHGIAIASELQKGFISSGRDSSVTIFDLKSLATIEKVYVTGKNPDAILYDSFTDRVFVFNGRTSNSTVIDAKKNKVIETIPLEGKPEFSVSDGTGKVYVNIEDKNEIGVINASTMKVEKYWSIKPGDGPSGLAIDNINHRLFSVCDNKLMIVVDATSGKIITTLPIGERVDGCGYDPGLARAYSSNGDGTLTVVQEVTDNNFKVLENVPTQKGARTIAVDAKTHHIYLPTAEYGATPDATTDNPHPRPSINPGTFVVLDVAPTK
jgi:DNA-binding beta-propeller fold protein YncE